MKNNSNQNSDDYFNLAEEEELNEQYVRDFIEDLLRDENFQAENIAKLKNRKVATLIEALPKKLQEYLQEIQRLEKESVRSREKDAEGKDLNSANPKTKKEIEAEKQRRARVKEIAKEIFIISCASSKGLEKSMEFFDKCQLKPEDLSKFGECGLSPLTAALLSGKIEKMQGLIDRGANVNEKNAYGFTARDFAEILGENKMAEVLKENGAKGINSQQREQEEGLQRQRKEEQSSEKKIKSDSAKAQKEAVVLKHQEAEMQRLQQEQIRIYREMAAIYEHFLAQEKLAKEAEIKANKANSVENQNRESEPKQKREVDTNGSKISENREREISAVKELQEIYSKIDQEFKQTNSQSKEFSEQPKQAKESKSAAVIELEKILKVDLAKEDINKLLFNSVKAGQPLVAVLLINCGANINHREGSKTIIDVAVDNGDGAMIGALSMFSRREVLVSAISQAIEKGNCITPDLREAIIGKKVVQQESDSVSTLKPQRDSLEAQKVASPSLKQSEQSLVKPKEDQIVTEIPASENNAGKISRSSERSSPKIEVAEPKPAQPENANLVKPQKVEKEAENSFPKSNSLKLDNGKEAPKTGGENDNKIPSKTPCIVEGKTISGKKVYERGDGHKLDFREKIILEAAKNNEKGGSIAA